MRVDIKLVRHALRAILKNERLHKVMHLILTIGNYMNHGSRKGNAHGSVPKPFCGRYNRKIELGFHVSLLRKLSVTKSTTGLSLLDWVRFRFEKLT